jgi:2'-5' RNA ligase
MRAFIAVEIPERVKDKLIKIQGRLRRAVPSSVGAGFPAAWVKRDKLHLTLVFFASISEEQAGEVGKIIKDKLESLLPTRLRLGDLGVFPNLDFPRVVWIALDGEIKTFEKLTAKIKKALKTEQIPFDPKPFVPHLTLARLRRMKPQQRRQITRVLTQFRLKEKPDFGVRRVSLVKSQLTPKGPNYQQLFSVSG